MTHFGTKNTSCGQKKGRESNCQFDFQPLKIRNCPDFFTFRWHATYHWKALNEGYNFALVCFSIGGLHTKLWVSKVVGVPILRISGLQLGNLRTKWHLGVGLVAKHRVYYKGEGGGFPQVWVVVSLMSLCLHVAYLCTKNASTTHLPSCCLVCVGPCE
jgi:hypothetical protein